MSNRLRLRVEWHTENEIEPEGDSTNHELEGHKFYNLDQVGVDEIIDELLECFLDEQGFGDVDLSVDRGGSDECEEFDFPTASWACDAKLAAQAAALLLKKLEAALQKYEVP